jgi:hypothetical protein
MTAGLEDGLDFLPPAPALLSFVRQGALGVRALGYPALAATTRTRRGRGTQLEGILRLAPPALLSFGR